MKKELLNIKQNLFIPLIISIFCIGFTANSFAYVLPQSSTIQAESPSFIKYKGRVIDKETRKPLAYVDITVNSANISTITNREGKFSIKIPNNLTSNKLSVSFLGYETLEISINSLDSKKQHHSYKRPKRQDLKSRRPHHLKSLMALNAFLD